MKNHNLTSDNDKSPVDCQDVYPACDFILPACQIN